MIDLSSFGLTENQSQLYQTGLQYGSRTVTFLGKKAGMHRVLAYNTLQELCRLGYASCVMKGNTGHYSMVDPNFIKEKLQQRVASFDGILPQLQGLINRSQGGFKVKLFQGRDGIKALYDQLTYSKTNFKAYLGADHIDPEILNYLYDVYLPKRLSQGIHSQAIVSATDANKFFADPNNVPQTEVVIIDDDVFDLDCEIILFDDNKISMAALSTEEMSGLLIESKNLYTSLEKLFDLLRKLYKT